MVDGTVMMVYVSVCIHFLGLDLCTQGQGHGMTLNLYYLLLIALKAYMLERRLDIISDEENGGQAAYYFVTISQSSLCII